MVKIFQSKKTTERKLLFLKEELKHKLAEQVQKEKITKELQELKNQNVFICKTLESMQTKINLMIETIESISHKDIEMEILSLQINMFKIKMECESCIDVSNYYNQKNENKIKIPSPKNAVKKVFQSKETLSHVKTEENKENKNNRENEKISLFLSKARHSSLNPQINFNHKLHLENENENFINFKNKSPLSERPYLLNSKHQHFENKNFRFGNENMNLNDKMIEKVENVNFEDIYILPMENTLENTLKTNLKIKKFDQS